MSFSSELDPTEKFTDRADIYDRARPRYSAEAIDAIFARCDLKKGSRLVDVGCGTGIVSRLFAEREVHVIAVEPNEAMVKRAISYTPTSPSVRYVRCRAEQLGLRSSYADAVLAAQAFHWFRADEALREFHRVLKPGAWTVLMWSERDESDAFSAAYGDILHTLPNAIFVENRRRESGTALRFSPYFSDFEMEHHSNSQAFDEKLLLERTFSTSFVPREGQLAKKIGSELHNLFERHQQNGLVVMRYRLDLYFGKSRH